MERTAIDSPIPRKQFLARLLRLPRLLPLWLRRTLTGLFLLGYFGFALLVLALRYWVLPNIENYRGDIERGISAAVGLNVTISRIDTDWSGLRPHLSLHGFKLHDTADRPVLTFDTVETDLGWSSVLHRQLRLHRLEVHAPELTIRRDRNGRIFIAGLQINTEASGTDFSDWLLAQKNVAVRDATIRWEDEQRGAPPLELRQLNFVLRNDGNRHRFGLTALPPAELAARIDIRGDFRGRDIDRPELWKGEVYAELDYADLAVWRAWVDYPLDLPQGAGGMRLWLGFDDKKLRTLTADIALRDVKLRLARNLEMLELKHFNGRIAGRLPDDGFEVSTKKLTLATKGGISLSPTDFSLRWTPAQGKQPANGAATANGLDLDVLAKLASYLPLDAGTRATLEAYAPRGRVFDLKLGWKGDAETLTAFNVSARFEALGRRAHGYYPGFDGLTGRIDGNEKGGRVEVTGRNASVELPTVFADPRLELDEMKAQASWTAKDGRFDVQLQNFTFNNPDANGSASGRYLSDPQGPGEIDITANLSRADGAAVWRYMPLGVNRDVRDWLREAIRGGRADDAKLRLQGNLKDFPFAEGKNGIFKVTAKISGTNLRYAPDWPGIENIAGDLLFEGRRMSIKARQGRIFGVSLSGVSAEIDDLEAPEEILNVSGRAAGPTADFLHFVSTSPVAEKIDRFTDGMKAEGHGTLALKLTLPLRRLEQSKIDGEYQFLRNALVLDPDLPPLTEVNGRLNFTADGIAIKDIRGQLLGSPLTVKAATRKDGTVAIDAQSSLNVAGLRKFQDHRIFNHLSGSAPLQGTVLVKGRSTEVVLESSLQGIASSLPAPFNKSATDVMPFRFERTSVSTGRDQIVASLGKALSAQLIRRADQEKKIIERGAVGLGEARPALPEKDILIAASVDEFDVDFWRGLFAGDGGNGGNVGVGLPLGGINLRAERMQLFDRPFNAVTLRASQQRGSWQGQVSSREVSGEFAWDGGEQGRLRARLKQLTLAETRPGKTVIAEEPLRELPGLDIVADSFMLHGMKLGKLELNATNADKAWRMDKLAISSPDGTLNSSGLWHDGGTQLNFKLDVADIGKMLDRLGYVDAVRRGTAKLEGKVSWAGPPTRIDHASLGGTMAVEAARGQFNKLDPGVGRLLGILSLQSLPRRITLVFRDIFSEGFAFDSIEGTSKIDRGVMGTKDLLIQGPSAKIAMKGEINIPAETQNLRVRVEPALGDTLAVGAMIANPAIGAAAWLAQKILKDPFGQMFAFEYAITGSWSDPKVEKLQQQATAKPEGTTQ